MISICYNKGEPINNPNENQPNPKNQPAIKVFNNEVEKLIRYIPKPIPKNNGRIEKGGRENVAIAPEK